MAVEASPWARRVAAACLGLLIVAGSLVLWIGLPVAGFWAAGQLTSSAQAFLFFVLAGVPLSMVLWGWGLYRLNGLYEALRPGEPSGGGQSTWLISMSDERADERRRRGGRPLIDVAMTVSAVVAIVAIAVWFFGFAHMWLAPLP